MDKDFSSKDKDCIVKDKDQDKDCILVLKESLRTRTNITASSGMFRSAILLRRVACHTILNAVLKLLQSQ